ncbi:MAG: STAS domain-containing protein [Actinomycetota bacterium]
MAISLIDFLRRTSRPHDAVLGVVPGRPGFHDVARVREAEQVHGALVYRFDAPLFYANAERFRARVRALIRRRNDVRIVVLEASTIPDIDVTAARMLGELQQELGDRGVRLVVAEAVGSVRDLLVGDELKEDFTAADMYDSVHQALGSIGVDG